MLSQLIELGSKVELQAVRRIDTDDKAKKIYLSQVHDILSEDCMEITMPMEQTKLILLPVDDEYDIIIFSESTPYQCFGRIIDRYKRNNMYILVVELTSNLRKYQRRDYYRYSCALEMCSRQLEEDEFKTVEEKGTYDLTPGLPLKRSVIVDISGGGLRFISSEKYEPGRMIFCTYNLLIKGENKKYEIVGKILNVKELENRPDEYEHRVQYVDMKSESREEIVKYIFEEERKSLRKERNIKFAD